MKKPASPRKEDGSKAPDKTNSDTPKKKITKPAPATGPVAKSSAKPAKASSPPSRQSAAAATKSGPNPKSNNEASRCGGTSKPAAAATSKRPGAKGKEAATSKTDSSADPEAHDQPERLQPTTREEQEPPDPPQEDRQSAARSGTGPETGGTPAAGSSPAPVTSVHCKRAEGAACVSGGQSHGLGRDSERPVDTPCSGGSTDTPLEDSWSIHHQVSPQSETGSTHTTSSDDIKPRSEDYDAGGSQDDDCSNDRGVSKCGTMRCHDFLGRSSSDTSTPEELKMYESGAGLRVEVRLRGREAETTSEEEGARQRPRSWVHRDEVSEVKVSGNSVPDQQIFSSEEEDDDDEETEEERSEVEVVPHQGPLPPTEPSPQFQGIVNLAFDDDGAEQDNEQPDYQSASTFRRSVLLSVDECEELGSEEGGVQTPPHQAGDVFDSDSAAPQSDCDPQSRRHDDTDMKHKLQKEEQREQAGVFLPELQGAMPQESSPTQEDGVKVTRDLPPQERPCHLDLRHAEQYSSGVLRNSQTDDFCLDSNERQLTGVSPRTAEQPPAGNV